MDTPTLLDGAAFVLGLLLGSFLNVCIARLPRRESVVRPGSRCLQCGVPIRWYDNLPLLSWVLLRGRCRDCHAPISYRYPAIELAMALWLLHAWRLFTRGAQLDAAVEGSALVVANGPRTAAFLLAALGVAVLGFLLLGLMVMDWQTQLLPDAFTLTGIAIGFLLACAQTIFLGPTDDRVTLSNHHLQLTGPGSVIDHGNVLLTGPEAVIGGRLFAICAAALPLLLVRWLYRRIRHREGLGLGDVKLLAMLAAFLGFWPAMLALFLGVMSAAIYSSLLLARGRANAATRLPLGSFLAAGGLVAATFGYRIINAYAALLR